jgi:hypothetical protein
LLKKDIRRAPELRRSHADAFKNEKETEKNEIENKQINGRLPRLFRQYKSTRCWASERERTAVGIIQQHTDTQQERRTRLNAEHKLATGKSREK